ncbi:zinc finger protein 423 isoform X2 [Harpegnathos saltator]|nr:zinc finger protein 423 isoform X2 [Harpegnathos saltator]
MPKSNIARNTNNKRGTKCNVCFINFKSSRNLQLHQLYFLRVGTLRCKFCSKRCKSQAELYLHVILCHKKEPEQCCKKYCHFCNRSFKKKHYLQSHLFHVHDELIYSNKAIEVEKSAVVLKNTSCKNTSKNSVHEESRLNNLDESKGLSTILINKSCKQSSDDGTTKMDKLIDQQSNQETLLTKKLRQPTLNEYIELCKKKRDTKDDLQQLHIMKDGLSTHASSHNEQLENLKPKLLKEAIHNGQIHTSTEKFNNNLEQITYASTFEQSENSCEECPTKEPFVKLHADVEMMKCFLENLPDANVESEKFQDQIKNTMLSEHDIPYSLRPTRAIRFLGYLNKKNFTFLKKSQLDLKSNTKMEQHANGVDKADLDSSKITMTRPKFKDCTITLKRCDEKLKNHPDSTTQITFEQDLISPITEPNSTFQKNDVKNNVVLKELEISLERLKTEQAEDNLETDIEKQDDDNCFTCKLCEKSFPTKINRRMHIKESHMAYMSSICNARYTLKHKLLQHYLREHTFKANECCVCNVLLSDTAELKQHLNYHCLKYFQNKDDQYPINIDVNCSEKGTYTCLKCNETFSSHLLWSVHDRYCPIQEKVDEVQKDSTTETNTLEVTLQSNTLNRNDVDTNTVIHNKNIQHVSHELPNNKRVEEPDTIRIVPVNEELRNNEKDMEIIEEPNIIEENLKINENDENFFGRKTIFIVENIGISKELQKPTKHPQTVNPPIVNNSIISDQDTTSVYSLQSNSTESNVKTYPCDICGKRFQNQKNLEQHIRSFSRVTEFCPLCNTAFSSKRYLQSHIAAAHVPQLSKNYDFHCVFCNQGFVKKYDLRPHVLHLHGRQMLETIMPNFRNTPGKDDESNNGNATCSVCNLAFETLDRYVEHRMYYYKNHKFTCSICSKDFEGMYMYHHHNKLNHYPEDKRKSYIYTCNICKEGFNHELHFYSHNMHVHPDEANSAEIVQQSTRYAQSVNNMEGDEQVIDLSMNQQNKAQLSSTDYICQICQFKCKNADDLKSHKLFYANDGDFKCNLCNRLCRTRNVLDQHKSFTHICRDVYNEHMCQRCNEILPSITSLRCHEKHFHANLVSYSNTNNCKYCGQTFSSSTECKEHQCKSTSSKTKEKYIYRCFYCDMKFVSLETIHKHILQAHFSKIFVKHVASNLELPSVSNDKIQKKTILDLVDQVVVSRKNIIQSFQQSCNGQNSISIMQDTQDKVAIEPTPEALKALFLIDVEPKQKTLNSTSTINGSEATTMNCNITTTREVEQNNQSKAITPVPTSTESTDISTKNHSLSDSFNISLEQMLDGHSIFSTGSADKSKATFTNVPPKSSNISNTPVTAAPIPRNEEIILQNCVSVNNTTDYSCPLCPLQYPSLMYFHAHLRYAHSDLIRNDLIYPQLDQLSEKIPVIECLLCPRISTDEKRYKRHLRHSHSSHMYLTNFKETKKIVDASSSLTTQTNSNNKTITPEVITVEDDDDDGKNSLVERAAAETAVEKTTCAPSTGNENVGKLKVKSFAKIIENLAIDRAKELLNKPN